MKINRLIACGVALTLCLGAAAIPAKRGMRTFRQADGTTISLRLAGDEFAHSYITSDGLAVSRQSDGNFHYISAQGISPVVAHDAAARSAAEVLYLSAGGSGFSAAEVLKARRAASVRKAPGRHVAPTAGNSERQVPCIGSPRIPVILVQYKDYKFKDSDPDNTFTEFFSQGAVSAYQYFVDQSNGMFTPQFDVYGPYTLSGNRSVYGGNDSDGYDIGVGKMVAEGCLGLDSRIDFNQYDNNGDGDCDVVIVLYAGDGEASSYDSDCDNAVWPCQWELSSSDYGKALNLDGTTVDKFAVFNELNGSDLSRIDGIGTFCHEFSHCLDLPDFYDTQYGPHFGMGDWSLMDGGSYNNDGYTPIGYSAYEKAFMGWIELEEAGENSFYTLPAMNQLSADTDKAVRITNAADPDEFYVLENRARRGWDAYMPAEGMLITHITYSAMAWKGNYVNDEDMQRVTPVPADNNLRVDKESYWGQTYYTVNQEDEKGDLWPGPGATELTDTSLPAAKVNSGGFLHKPVTEITRNADGTVSFWVMKTPLPAVAAPTGLDCEVISSTAVNVSWTAVDDSDVTYTLEIKQHKDIELLMSTDFTVNSHGWATSGYTEILSDGIRMGSNNAQGSVTSPAVKTAADGLVTVKFTAKYYSGDESSVKVSLLDAYNGDALLDSKTIALSSRETGYTVLLNGNADSQVKVRIETIAKKKRAYLKQADIYSGDASDMDSKAPAMRASDEISRTIRGITGTSCHVDGLLENGTFDCRVKAVPADSENYSDSPWTAKVQFILSDENSSAINIESAAAAAEYYNLQGLRLKERPAESGIYIERRGSQVRKIRVY